MVVDYWMDLLESQEKQYIIDILTGTVTLLSEVLFSFIISFSFLDIAMGCQKPRGNFDFLCELLKINL